MRSGITLRQIALATLASLAGCTAEGDAIGSSEALGHMKEPPRGHAGQGSPAPPKTGMLHALWTLNHEPMIDDITFADSKFVCGPSVDVCIRARDVDGDPLETQLIPAGKCTVEAHAAQESSDADHASVIDQCWTVACHELGRADLTAKVFDTTEDKGKQVRIETLLHAAGGTSHGELAFFAYFEGTLFWPDRDADAHGDRKALAKVVCGDDAGPGWVQNHDDCNDKNKATFPLAAEVCWDRVDNNCNGLIDEKCIFHKKPRHR